MGPEREGNHLGGTPVVISNGVVSASGKNHGGNSMEDIDRLMRRMQDEDELRDEI
jgi:hypothetical protein